MWNSPQSLSSSCRQLGHSRRRERAKRCSAVTTWRHQCLFSPLASMVMVNVTSPVTAQFCHSWWCTTWRHHSLCPPLISLVTDNMTSSITLPTFDLTGHWQHDVSIHFFHSWLHCPLMHATALSTAHQALVSELNGLICFLKMMLKT